MLRTTAGVMLLLVAYCHADEPSAKVDGRFPYRTSFANEHLPWYQIQAGVFPPSHAEDRQSGELLEVDPLQRSGKFRRLSSGEVVEFRMLPFGIANYLGAETELRHLPLGTRFLFYLYPDKAGNFTLVGNMLDDFTIASSHSWTYRVDDVSPATGEITVTQQSIPKKTISPNSTILTTTEGTRFWKGNGEVATLADITSGMALLFNTAPAPKGRGPATDIWIDAESQDFATSRQKEIRVAYLKERGIAGWVNHTTDTQFTVIFFNRNNRDLLEQTFQAGKEVKVAVAEETLQTYRPWIDGMTCRILEVKKVPSSSYANSGFQIHLEPRFMLEGFRKGRVVRVYGPGWQIPSLPPEERLFP